MGFKSLFPRFGMAGPRKEREGCIVWGSNLFFLALVTLLSRHTPLHSSFLLRPLPAAPSFLLAPGSILFYLNLPLRAVSVSSSFLLDLFSGGLLTLLHAHLLPPGSLLFLAAISFPPSLHAGLALGTEHSRCMGFKVFSLEREWP